MVSLQAALLEEIAYLQKSRQRSSYTLYDGILLSSTKQESRNGDIVSAGYYRFKNTQLINLAPDTGALFTIGSEKHGGFIQFCDRYGIEVTIEDCIASKIDRVTVEIESWRLLEIQSNRLSKMKHNSFVQMLQGEHLKPSAETEDFSYGQENAIVHAKSNHITVIWGPPGTGKTYTLAKIAISEAVEGRRVLILSQSNMAVDSAIIQIRKASVESGDDIPLRNKIFRFGMVKSPDLLQFRHLLSWDASFDSRPDLKSEYERLSKTLVEDKEKSPQEIRGLNNARREILTEIGNIEMKLIRNAKIVAMTATKATISKHVYEQDWDTVIFDEISMAYISQIMIAASMAKKKLVLIGDFKQLAPIVQNDNSASLLRKDIFSFINIVNGDRVRKHPWLVMLNMQWRMHPDIVEFANRRIYSGKLMTAPASINETTAIAELGPFPSSVFSYIDYSAFNGTCFSTRNGSRFNLFSAAITVKTALEAVSSRQNDIGIVTPYAAQSQLINAILQDIEERRKKHLPIFCATIHQFQGSERDVIIFDSVESFPKRETGKIVSSEDDSSMRLINVALTRARGKFIIIGNNEYLRLHQNEISQDMWELIRESRAKCHITEDGIEHLLLNNVGGNTIRFFSSVSEATPLFQSDLCKCNQKAEGKHIEYWHAPRNSFISGRGYRFIDFITDSQKAEGVKRIFTSDSGVDDIQNAVRGFPKEKIRNSGVAPKDDFVLIDDTSSSGAAKIIWLNMISVASNSDNGKRVPYSFTGNNIVYQFRKLSDFDFGLRKASDTAKAKKATAGVFASFIAKRHKCSVSGCPKSSGIKLQKAKSGKYYIKCADCDQTISQFIPNDDLKDYVEEYNFRCKTCGGKISISKYGRPYCTKDYKHAVGYETNDIIEKDPPSKKSATSAKKPVVTVIKKNH